jgi:hypothetical protein
MSLGLIGQFLIWSTVTLYKWNNWQAFMPWPISANKLAGDPDEAGTHDACIVCIVGRRLDVHMEAIWQSWWFLPHPF